MRGTVPWDNFLLVFPLEVLACSLASRTPRALAQTPAQFNRSCHTQESWLDILRLKPISKENSIRLGSAVIQHNLSLEQCSDYE